MSPDPIGPLVPLIGILNAAIEDRHRAIHRRDIKSCADPVCEAHVNLQAAIHGGTRSSTEEE